MDNISSLISSIEDYDLALKELKKKRDECERQLSDYIAKDVSNQLSDKDYGCGTATIIVGNYKVKAVVSKKVEYDQSKLADLFDKIRQSGDDPFEYIKVKYDVSEAAFKNWPSNIQAAFEPSRTVEPSKPKITFEKIGE